MDVKTQPAVSELINNYPEDAQQRLLELRALILRAASEIAGIEALEETLKWGEPSYLAKKGSTVRMDWKEKQPEQVAMYFKCTSKLVPTFKSIYPDTFKYVGNRAILFDLNEVLPETELIHCMSLALTYHKVKHLPRLGA